MVQVCVASTLTGWALHSEFMSWEDFDVRSGSEPKETEGESARMREGRSPLVSDLFSQCPPHISAGWQPFGAITCQAVTDLRVMCSVHAEGFFFVWSGGEVCAGSKLRASVEAWTERRKMCSCWWDAGVLDVGAFWRKWKKYFMIRSGN